MKAIFFIFLAILLIPAQLIAGGKDIAVLSSNHVPPFKIIEGETLRGINADVLGEIFKGTQLTLKLRKCPWTRCLDDLEKGKSDVLLGMFKTPAREKRFYFCEPPYKQRSDKAFYLRKGQGHKVQRYEDLYPLRIGVTRGYKNFEPFDSDERLNKDFIADHAENIKKLVFGRIDVFVMTEVAADYLITKGGYADKIEKAGYKYGEIHPSYFVVSRKSPLMNRVAEFEKNLSRFVEAKKLLRIHEKWTH